MENPILIDKVLDIKDKLKAIELKYTNLDPEQKDNFVSISEVQSEVLDTLLDYPLEYQIFLKEIGEVYIAYGDAFMLEVSLPKHLGDIWWFSYQESSDLDKYRIIVHTDNNDINYAIYDITKIPFERYYQNIEVFNLSFLKIIEDKINELL
jgi:hypothetical protein